jgi:hypothetical protein
VQKQHRYAVRIAGLLEVHAVQAIQRQAPGLPWLNGGIELLTVSSAEISSHGVPSGVGAFKRSRNVRMAVRFIGKKPL